MGAGFLQRAGVLGCTGVIDSKGKCVRMRGGECERQQQRWRPRETETLKEKIDGEDERGREKMRE